MRRPLLLLAALLPAGAALAQANPKPPAKQAFYRQVIPQPTGKNGYEELVLAAELFQNHRYYGPIQRMDSLPLATKRAILDDKEIIRTLQLVRQGLKKPIYQPRQELTFSTLLPEMAPLRDLGRLLALQQYVLLADGRTAEALGSARLGMRLGRAIQMDTLIAGLIGIAVSTVCIQPLAGHLDQLTARDCVTLHEICLEWLNQPDPQITLLMAEQRWMKVSLHLMKEQVKRGDLSGAVRDLGLTDQALKDYEAFIPKTPEAIDAFFGQTVQRYDEHMATVFAELRKPEWERKVSGELKPQDPGGYLASFLVPGYGLVNDRFTKEKAQVQMLACHAAIRRYQWEHDRLPGSLEELKLGKLAVDPFTGAALRYEVRGRRYSLTAAGSEARNAEEPGVVDGRKPVTLTPDD